MMRVTLTIAVIALVSVTQAYSVAHSSHTALLAAKKKANQAVHNDIAFAAPFNVEAIGLTNQNVVDVMCLLRTFHSALEPKKNEQPWCENTQKPLDRWVEVTDHEMERVDKVAYANGEFVMDGKLHCKLFRSKAGNFLVAAFRHMEGEDDGTDPDGRYAIKKFSYEGAIIGEQIERGSTLDSKYITSMGGFFMRHSKNPFRELTATSYETLAERFIERIASQVEGVEGLTLIAAGYSLGGGLAQHVGLNAGINPPVQKVLSFAGNGPITSNDRARDGVDIVNFVVKRDSTHQIGCHSRSSQVCLINGAGVPHEHLDVVYGAGPKSLSDALAAAAPDSVDWRTFRNAGVLCFRGDEYSKMCCICRNEKDHPNVQYIAAGRRAAATRLQVDMCLALPARGHHHK